MKLVLFFLLFVWIPFTEATPRSSQESVTITIFGEIHGTNEIPAFFLNWVKQQQRNHQRPLIVGLEIRHENNAGGADIPGAECAVLGEFWQGMQDGRKSKAMLNLVTELHSLSDITIIAMDGSSPQMNRNAYMTYRISQAIHANPEVRDVAILVGRAHAGKAVVEWEAASKHVKPLGYRLADSYSVTSLTVAHDGGQAWLCYRTEKNGVDCSEKQREPQRDIPLSSQSPIVAFDRPENGFDGVFYVGNISSSEPAIEALNPQAD